MTEQPAEVSARYWQINGLTLDLLNRTVDMDDHPVRLSLAEFAYLAVLARQAPNVVDYVSLVKQARGDRDIDRNTTRALCKHYIRALRQALDLGQSRSCLIISYRGVGFALTGPGLAPAGGATPGDQPQETTGGGERRGPLSLDCGR